MKRALRVLCLPFVIFGVSASAQDESMHEDVQMNVGMPGAGMGVEVNVHQRSRHSRPPPPAAEPVRYEGRDCGTGQDTGCTMQRGGEYPMDAETFRGFIDAMRANSNELERQEIAKSTLETSYMTAKQLGVVLDLFDNEISRYEVAQLAAPKLVNPKHALGHAKKFPNDIYARDYTKLMTAQR